MVKPADTKNLNGELLGISALIIYSVPLSLQLMFLALVALLFFLKVARQSKETQALLAEFSDEEPDKVQEFLSKPNHVFLGFAVRGEDVAPYWIGLLIFAITLAYSTWNLIEYLNA